MDEIFLHSDSPVTLLGAGEADAATLRLALARAPRLVAADAGASAALALGLVPDLVIGDLDSLDAADLARLPTERVRRIDEQETTDFDKALRSVAAPLVLGVGFLGARLDHELAAMNVLVRSRRRCVLLGTHDVAFAAPPGVWLPLDLAAGDRVSLFPMAPVGGRSEGLEWPIEGLDFRPDAMTGTSNAATGPVRLWFGARGMLVILPRTALDAALAALPTSE